ncbi:hypothetical protein F443_16056, partial [Phytophthora nicotianae P1569]
ALCSRLQVFQSIRLTPGSIRDLQWCQHILSDGNLEHLPLRFCGSLPEADINIYMDASDTGLAVLHPARSEFILLKFDEEEALMIQNSDSTGFTINVREHFCMALAAWCWGSKWHQDFHFPHVVCWSDNVSAVSWINQLQSRSGFGQ